MKTVKRFVMLALAAAVLLAACDPEAAIPEPTPEVPPVIVATELALSANTLELNVSLTDTLTVSFLPDGVTEEPAVTWSSSDPAIATVDDSGIVTALALGTTIITATTTDGTLTASSTVHVIPIRVTGVTLNTDILETNVGVVDTLTATILPVDAADSTVTWSSSDPAIATVDDNGIVTALALGTTIITATTTDGALTASSTVNVLPPPIITVGPLQSQSYYFISGYSKHVYFEVSVDQSNKKLFYQWYGNHSQSYEGAYPIAGETSRSISFFHRINWREPTPIYPPPYTPGHVYIFCEVSTTGGAIPKRTGFATMD